MLFWFRQNVCFECDVDAEPIESKQACAWSMKYRSVIGFGKASFIESPEEKTEALKIIMEHYSDEDFHFPLEALNKTAVIKVEIEHMTGKKSGI